MGGRGASSPSGKYTDKHGVEHTYGSEYTTLLQRGNIKFIIRNGKHATAPLETQIAPERKPKGRIYVSIDGEAKITNVSFYKGDGKKFKTVDTNSRGHREKGIQYGPDHTHKGYEHKEDGTDFPTRQEMQTLNRVKKLWDEFSMKNPELIAAIKNKGYKRMDQVRKYLPAKK